MAIQKKAAKLGEQGGQCATYCIYNANYNSSELVSTAAVKPVQIMQLLTALECHTNKVRVIRYVLAGESKDAVLNLLRQHHGAMRVIVCRRYA